MRNCTRIAQQTNSSPIYLVVGNFSLNNCADFGLFRFRGKKTWEFGFQTLLVGITFCGIHLQYLKVTNMEAIWSFLLHCFQPSSLKFSNGKEE